MSTSQLSIQSAVARRAAEAELRRLIAKFAPAYLRLIGTTRRWLRKRLPTAHEVVYEYRDCFVISYSPDERGYKGVLAIRTSADGVRLYFNRGKGLPDPAKLLRGSGKQTRWIHLEGASILGRPEVARLIDEAIARNRVPFPRAGRGPVVIRSVSTKPRRRIAPFNPAMQRTPKAFGVADLIRWMLTPLELFAQTKIGADIVGRLPQAHNVLLQASMKALPRTTLICAMSLTLILGVRGSEPAAERRVVMRGLRTKAVVTVPSAESGARELRAYEFEFAGKRVKTVEEFKAAVLTLPKGAELFWDSGCFKYTSLPVAGPPETIAELKEFCSAHGIKFTYSFGY